MVITSIWWGFGLLILLIFFWIAANPENFGEYRENAIDWVLPHFIPTMTLTGAVAYTRPAAGDCVPDRNIRFAFVLTCLVSIVYLLMIAAIIALAVTGFGEVETERGAVDTLTSWNKVLGVFQGLAASAIGVFFVRNDGRATDSSREEESRKQT
jgi:uncharacterized membrane protein YGL010W